MKENRKPKPLNKLHIMLLISSLSLIIISSSYFYLRYQAGELKENKRNELKVITDIKADQISKWQREMISYPRIFSESPFFISGVENWLGGKSGSGSKEVIKKRLSLMNIYSNYENIFIASPEGKLLVSINDSLSYLDSVTVKLIANAVNGGKAVCTDFYHCPLHKRIHLDYICPIYNWQNKAIAVLVFRVNPDKEFFNYLKEWPSSSATSEFYLIEKRKDKVVLLNQLNHKKNTALNIEFPTDQTDLPAIKGINGIRGVYEGRDINGREVVSYINSVPGTDWLLIALIDKTELYHQLYYHESVIVLFALLLVIVVSIGLIWFYHFRQRNIFKELLIKSEKLRESEDKFEKIFHSAPVMIGITDLETGMFINVNEAAENISGYKKEELMGHSSTEINWISVPDREKIIKELSEKGSVRSLETVHVAKNGETINCIVNVEKIYLQGRECLLSVLIDISQRKKLEEELELHRYKLEELVKERTEELAESNKKLESEICKKNKTEELLKVSLEKEIELNRLKTRFITNTSHEFRTPLTAILSSAELIQRYAAKWDADKTGMHVDRIKNAVDYLSKLLADVLTVYNNEAEKTEPIPADVNCIELCRNIIRECSMEDINGCSVQLKYNCEMEKYRIDEKQVGVIIANLLSNACKYSTSGGKVELIVNQENNKLQFIVKDEGMGIPEKDLPFIYDSFYRADNVSDIRGNGLGLAIVKNAINSHRGNITILSELNIGTSAIVEIPLES